MERIIYRKTLNVHKNGIQFTLQGFETADNMSRQIELSLMASGDVLDLPLEHITALMYITTPGATEPSINECEIKDNTIIYNVLPIVEEGITEMQLKLIETKPDGANGVLAAPRFAVEVSKSNTSDEDAIQTTTFTALENAIARANSVYESRLVKIELDQDCTYRVHYADGTVYESDVLKELFLKGDALLSQSYARGDSGVRVGEETDNSMYYSNVSRSASLEAEQIRKASADILAEVSTQGVYTTFVFDFEKGELMYKSPKYTFAINPTNGKLEFKGSKYGNVPLESDEYPGCYYNEVYDSSLGEHIPEWINPPMVVGESYRTIERFDGKKVYACIFDGTDANYDNLMAVGKLPSYAKCVGISGFAKNGNVVQQVDSVQIDEDGTVRFENNGAYTEALIIIKYTCSCTVAFLDQNGNVSVTIQVEYGEDIPETVLSKVKEHLTQTTLEGYVFTGNFDSPTTNIEQDTTIQGIYDLA